MGSEQVIMWMIAACVIFAGFLLFSKPLKAAARIFIQAVIGTALMYVVNFILSPFSLAVGINLLTAFIVGVLGLPGLCALYILQAFL